MNKTKLYYEPELDYMFLITKHESKSILHVKGGVYVFLFNIDMLKLPDNAILLDEDFYDCANDSDRYMNEVNK